MQVITLFAIPVTITGIWSLVRYNTLYYLSSTLPHSVIIQGPVHNVPSHHNSSQHLCDHNISPRHHHGCARDCSFVGFVLFVKYESASKLYENKLYYVMSTATVLT